MESMRTVFSWPPGQRKTMLLGSLPSPVAKKAVRKYFFGSRLARGRLVPRILGPLVARIFPGRRCTHLHTESFNFKSEEKTLPCLKGPEHRYLRTPRAPFGRPKRHQNRSQNDQKSKRKIKTKKKRSKTILGPSWGDLGPSWGAIVDQKTPQTLIKRMGS